MRRLNKYAVKAVRGEIHENILEFEEVFGVKFGAAAKVSQYFGDRDMSTNAGTICVHFKTSNLSEVDVGFLTELSPISFAMFKDVWKIMISDHPWAHFGDEGNIVEGFNCMTFLSDDGKDPKGITFTTGYVRNPAGGYHLGPVEVPPRPDGGLRPSTDYWLTLRSPKADGEINPIYTEYRGTNDPNQGGEKPIVNRDLVKMGVGIPFSLGTITGVFIPD